MVALLFSRRPSSSRPFVLSWPLFISSHLLFCLIPDSILSHPPFHLISRPATDPLEDHEFLATLAAVSASPPPFTSSNFCKTPTELQMLVQGCWQQQKACRSMGKSDLSPSLSAPAPASARKRSRWFHMMIPVVGGWEEELDCFTCTALFRLLGFADEFVGPVFGDDGYADAQWVSCLIAYFVVSYSS